jgi:hypothetical protein
MLIQGLIHLSGFILSSRQILFFLMFVGDFKIPPFRFDVDSFNNKTTAFGI